MTFSLILILAAVTLALVLLRAVRGEAVVVCELQQLEGRTLPVDLAAFRNLVDPGEEEFLRERLPASKFRSIQRLRMRAATEYVRRTSHNAAILLRLGEAASRNPKPEIAAAGRELVNSALLLRINALLGLGVLYARIAFPGAKISYVRVVEGYQNLTEGVVRLTRLQNPAYAARVSAVI